MKKILWLPSWYPNKTAPFDGDFIQRMAKATSLYTEIHVFFVVKDESLQENLVTTSAQNGNLYETIAYYKGSSFLPRLLSWKKYFSIYNQLIRGFIEKHGKPHLVHVQVPVKAGLIALWLKRNFGIDYVCTEHFAIYNDEVVDRFSRRSFYFKHYTQKVFKEARALLPVSQNLGEEINARVIKKDFQVIFNVADTGLFYYMPSAQQKFRFIHVSEMGPRKNVTGIIQAFCALHKQQPDTELILAGPYTAQVFEAAKRSGLLNTAIFFTGQLSYETIALNMRQANVLILFSNIENMPCVIIEALCCGLPVISTKTGGIAEVIDNNNGILVPVGDETALLQSMQQLKGHYNQYNRATIAEHARQQFSYNEIGHQINEVYNRVLQSSAGDAG
jgi:glycosyltransferase involved in cell wall biosynthesis